MEDAPVASATPAPLVPPAALGVAQNPFDVDETQMQILQQVLHTFIKSGRGSKQSMINTL